MLALQAITGPDAGDVSSVPSRLDFDAAGGVKGLRVGYFPKWMQESPATEVDRAALETVKKIGMVPVEVSIPDWPYDSLNVILFAEGAAASEEITLNHVVDQLKVQTYDAWPNIFRQSRFLSAVEFVQADRLGGRCWWKWQGVFAGGYAARAVAARRNPDNHELHRASVADYARRVCRGHRSTDGLGARPQPAFAKILAA
jgi:hypothetical protein